MLRDLQSVVCVALCYEPSRDDARDQRLGRIARYAAGEDYHRLMNLAGYQEHVDKTADTGLKVNISWHFFYPGSSTTPWKRANAKRSPHWPSDTDFNRPSAITRISRKPIWIGCSSAGKGCCASP